MKNRISNLPAGRLARNKEHGMLKSISTLYSLLIIISEKLMNKEYQTSKHGFTS